MKGLISRVKNRKQVDSSPSHCKLNIQKIQVDTLEAGPMRQKL